MWAEILEQPRTYERVVDTGLDLFRRESAKGLLSLPTIGRFGEVIFFGNGSSYHAACLARDYLLSVARMPARAVYASDAFQLPESRTVNALALALSHSGSSTDVLGAVERARHQGVATIAITNIPGSPLTQAVEPCWVTGAGREDAIPSTKGFTALAAASLLLASHIGEARGVAKVHAKGAAKRITHASRSLASWLDGPDRTRFASSIVASARAVAFVGKGMMYPVACDGALKLLEVAYLPALAYPPEEFRHGPVALADERFVLIGLMPRRHDPGLARLMEDVRDTGASVIAVGPVEPKVDVDWIDVPGVDSLLSPLVYMPALQMMAHGVGAVMGLPIDRPRGLQKVVGAA
jgi:glucosamine--fructose-6-phosphate aminotransferase (isomerizing)